MKYLLLFVCFFFTVQLVAEIYECKVFLTDPSEKKTEIINASEITLTRGDDGKAIPINLVEKIRLVAAEKKFESSHDFTEFVLREYGVRLWKVKDHSSIGPNEVYFTPHRSLKYYIELGVPILLCVAYGGLVIFCFIKSFCGRWRKLDIIIFGVWTVSCFVAIINKWKWPGEDELWVSVIPWSVIALIRFFALRKKFAELIRLGFSQQNYFKTLILIFAAIITLCILFMTFHFCGPF